LCTVDVTAQVAWWVAISTPHQLSNMKILDNFLRIEAGVAIIQGAQSLEQGIDEKQELRILRWHLFPNVLITISNPI
jgi:hypothetical protein